MLTIDGAAGEGGGQLLRGALALSLLTGTAFRLTGIRAGRRKPGLMRQHLTAVQAAAAVGSASASGAAIGSRELLFEPRRVRAGRHDVAVGMAGSVTLVLQTLLPALLAARQGSELTLTGGTHGPKAPPFEFLERAFLPLIARMGAGVRATLERPGFLPAGGGRLRVQIEPRPLARLDLPERGAVRAVRATALVAHLPDAIGQRELEAAGQRLGWDRSCWRLERLDSSAGPGNALELEIQSEHVTELVTGFGRKGVRAESVAEQAADEALHYLAAGVPVGRRLAEQLLVPLAACPAGGSFRTLPLSRQATTQIELIQRFLEVEVRARPVSEHVWEVAIGA